MEEEALSTSLLIVDDEQDLREVLAEYFKDLGATVHEAASGNQAWSVLETQSINVIITDMRMPDGSGQDFIKKIHQAPKFRDIPIIILSGYTDFGAAELQKFGVSEFISKPASLKKIKEAVEKCLS